MTVQRGQYYQHIAIPTEFYQVVRIFSPTQIQLLELDLRFSVYQTTTQVETLYWLLPALPQNHTSGELTTLSASGGKGSAPTYLRATLAGHSKKTKALLVTA